MKINSLIFATILIFASCASSTPPTSTQARPQRPPEVDKSTLQSFQIQIPLILDASTDIRGAQIAIERMILPQYGMAHQWQVYEKKGDEYVSSYNGTLYEVMINKIDEKQGPGNKKIVTYSMRFLGKAEDLPYTEYRIVIPNRELATPDTSWNSPQQFPNRVLSQLSVSQIKARLIKLEYLENEGLVGTVWVAR